MCLRQGYGKHDKIKAEYKHREPSKSLSKNSQYNFGVRLEGKSEDWCDFIFYIQHCQGPQ